MPLYEYQCEKCDSVFEALQKFSDAPLTVHPVCGGAVRKLLSASAFQFKGTGWYVTDYGKGKGNGMKPANGNGSKHDEKPAQSKGESKSETKSESKGESKSESKSESKPAAKPETATKA
jgi:putative FmdB family regulatory protein